MMRLYQHYQKWRAKNKARRLYIELTDRLSKESLKDPLLIRELDSLYQITQGHLEGAKETFKNAQARLKRTPRTLKGQIKEIATLITLAFLILVVNRQLVFEHQQIPTGSMRPTFFEMDRLIVSKTAFGINNPFHYKPLLMDKSLFQRGQIVTFTSEGLALENQDVKYFGLFNGKKRLVKRLMAKGGDRVYFYGGHLWILDKEEKLHVSSQFLEKKHDYIPFHQFFGQLKQDPKGNVTSYHFQRPVFQIQKSSWNLWKNPEPNKPSQPWGIHNYAMARLLTPSQAKTLVHSSNLSLEEPYYLDIAHHASITPTAVSFRDVVSPFYVHRTLLPLSSEHLKKLRSNLYTSRFRVKDQKAYRYDHEQFMTGSGIHLSGVPNGLYELYHGIAYSVREDGERTALETSHPLYQEVLTPIFFNMGMDWNAHYQFKESISALMPYRYVYYDEGSLKCLDGLLMDKDDPALKKFIAHEITLNATSGGLYPSFIDEGAPSIQKIKNEGFALGDEEVMLLGDNHAGSGDSRDFGLATYEHIQGSPFWRFWPFSSLKAGIDTPFRGCNRYDLFTWGFLAALCFVFDKWRNWRLKQARNFVEG